MTKRTPTDHASSKHTMAITVCAYGGGTNSTAMLVELARRGQLPNLILFADTGGERPETYAYVAMFDEWLRERGCVGIETVRYTTREGITLTLEQHSLNHKMLPSLAYGFKSCSLRFKRGPQDKYVNNWEPAREAWKRGEKIVKLIGYDLDERHRAKIEEDKKYTYRYPLIEWGWGRDECVEVIASAQLPQPGKSACFFCPASKVSEILELPCDLKTRAVAMERNAELDTVKGLGRRFSWDRLIQGDYDQQRLAFMPPPPPCDCFDGDDDS